MYLAASRMMQGNMSIGDFVLVNNFILTLYSPLAFLGMYYRMLKQLVVDVENMFKIFAEKLDVKDVRRRMYGEAHGCSCGAHSHRVVFHGRVGYICGLAYRRRMLCRW